MVSPESSFSDMYPKPSSTAPCTIALTIIVWVESSFPSDILSACYDCAHCNPIRPSTTFTHRYASATFQNGYLRLILPDGAELRYGDPSRVVVPGAKGEEWRGRPAIGATLRIFDFSFFRKVSSTGVSFTELVPRLGGYALLLLMLLFFDLLPLRSNLRFL